MDMYSEVLKSLVLWCTAPHTPKLSFIASHLCKALSWVLIRRLRKMSQVRGLNFPAKFQTLGKSLKSICEFRVPSNPRDLWRLSSSTMQNAQLLGLVGRWKLSPRERNRSSYVQTLR